MNVRILGGLAAALLVVSPVIAGCGGSSVPVLNARQILSNDGYTPVSQAELASMTGGLPANTRPYVVSWAAGLQTGDPMGGAEVVFVLTPAGAAKVTAADLASFSGGTATMSGDVLRVDESAG
jgi:hypothetical protein